MALRTPYDEKADEEYAPGQGHDRAAGKSSDPRSENAAAGDPSDPRGDLLDREENAGVSSGTGIGSRGSSSNTGGGLYSPGGLKDAEEAGDDEADDGEEDDQKSWWAGDSSSSTRKGRTKLTLTRRKAIIGAGTAGIFGGAIGFFTIASGPGQLIHLSEVLQKNESSSSSTAKVRITRLYRLARTGNFGETRVGMVASKVVSRTRAQLSDIGVEFHSDRLDHLTSATFDTGKLSKNFPEIKNMSEAEARAYIADKLKISVNDLTRAGPGSSTGSHTFSYDVTDGGLSESKLLLKNSVAAFGENGTALTAIKVRPLKKFFNIPSLFHPLQRAQAALGRRASAAVALKEEENRMAAEQKPVEAAAGPAESSLKDKLKGQNILGKALLLTAGMCLVRDVADDVVKVNRAAIVIPAVVQATDKIAVGEQAKAGQDITSQQAGDVVRGFTDPTTHKTIWASKALEATAGMPQTGEDLTHDYQQAFSGDTTAQGIKQYLGGGGFGDVACSPEGKLVQGIVGVAIVISGFFDAGASWGAKAAAAGDQAINATATAGVIYVLQQQFVKLLEDKAIVPKVLSGALGGSLLAYGAREAANISARSSGGVALTSQQEAMLNKQAELADQQQFRSESFFARMFDIKDYRSLAGHLADSFSPSLAANVADGTSSFMNLGSMIPHAVGSLLPRAHADPTYNWGFAKVGIPPEVANDPSMQDIPDNAQRVAALLDAGDVNGYIARAKTCFGDTISKDSGIWDVALTDAVNPNSDDYVNAHCNDLSDPNWKRVMLFVFDTNNVKAADCLQGGTDTSAQSCADLNAEDTGTASAPSTTASTQTSTIDPSTLHQDSSSIACAAGTTDVGVNTGYADGSPVKVRLCALPNLPSTSEESTSGSPYYISGSNGKALVNSRVSANFLALVTAAKADNIPMAANSSFRTMAHQQALCSSNPSCASGSYTAVAKPGTSNHQMGLAIDFAMADQSKFPLSLSACVHVGGKCEAPGDKVWEWLNGHSKNYGLQQYDAEFWHFSPDGK